jgi:hypothetical protein
LEAFVGVKYTLLLPENCGSWALSESAYDATGVYAALPQCIKEDLKTGLFTYRTAEAYLIGDIESCCAMMKPVGTSVMGWIVRELLGLSPEQQKDYNEHLAKEQIFEAKMRLMEDEPPGALGVSRGALEARQARNYRKLAILRLEKQMADAIIARQNHETCEKVYQSTASRKLSDLTVAEEHSVRTCQALDLYPPN